MNPHHMRLILALEHGPRSTRDLTLSGDWPQTVCRQLRLMRKRGLTLARTYHDRKGRHDMHALSRAGYSMARTLHAIEEDAGAVNWWESDDTEAAPSKSEQIVSFGSDGKLVGYL